LVGIRSIDKKLQQSSKNVNVMSQCIKSANDVLSSNTGLSKKHTDICSQTTCIQNKMHDFVHFPSDDANRQKLGQRCQTQQQG